MSTSGTIYDVNAYTESELLNMLGFSKDVLSSNVLRSSPTTYEDVLVRINALISKYAGIATSSSSSAAQQTDASLIQTFFTGVKSRFSTMNARDVVSYTQVSETNQDNATISSSAISGYGTSTSSGATSIDAMNSAISAGVLNPIPIASITRVISIDSRFRNTLNYPRSTDFSCTLTETLRNVLSLQLYFYHVPYTWYTVGSTFGNNFIYLISETPGINTSAYAIKIAISPGRYTEVELCRAINTSIKALYTVADNTEPLFADIYFTDESTSAPNGLLTDGTTTITGTFIDYTTINQKVKFYVKMAQRYTEPSFYVSFPGTLREEDAGIAANLTELFGLAATTPNSGVWNFDVRTVRSSAILADTTTTFEVSADNASFVLTHNNLDDTDLVGAVSITVSLIGQYYGTSTSVIVAGGTYTRAQLTEALTLAMADICADSTASPTKPLSFASGLNMTETETGAEIYELTLELNRKYASNYISSPKKVGTCLSVAFASGDIWTGVNSCFQFIQKTDSDTTVVQTKNVRDIISHTPTAYLQYVFPSNAILYFRCTNAKWNTTAAGVKTTVHDFSVAIGETMDDTYDDIVLLTAAINAKLDTYAATVYTISTTFSVSVSTPISSSMLSVVPTLTVDILKQEVVRVEMSDTTSGFTLSLSTDTDTDTDTSLWDTLFPNTNSNPYVSIDYDNAKGTITYTNEDTTTLTGNFIILRSSFLNQLLFSVGYSGSTIPALTDISLKIYGGTYTGDILSSEPYTSMRTLVAAMNTYFTNCDLEIKDVVENSGAAALFSEAGGSISARIAFSDLNVLTMTITLTASLTAADYSVFFLESGAELPTDATILNNPATPISANMTTWLNSYSGTTAWKDYFNFPGWLHLKNVGSNTQNAAKIYTSTEPISVAMYAPTDTYFDLRVSEDASGLYTSTANVSVSSLFYNDYRVIFSLPTSSSSGVSGVYTHAEIVSAINVAFASISDLSGSSVSIEVPASGRDISQHRTILTISVVKTFTQADYSMVFYSAEYFSSCAQANTNNPYLNTGTSRYSTLGWTLGFQIQNTMSLDTELAYIEASTPLITNPNSYLTLVLTDYVQSSIASHGMVSVLPPEYLVPRSSYADYMDVISSGTKDSADCMATQLAFKSRNAATPVLTNLGLFSSNQVEISTTSMGDTKSRISEAYSKDAFAVFPVNPSSAATVFMDYGQSLQSQERVYFGPVNLSRFSVQLRTSAGDLLDLNNANWGFAMLAKIAYT